MAVECRGLTGAKTSIGNTASTTRNTNRGKRQPAFFTAGPLAEARVKLAPLYKFTRCLNYKDVTTVKPGYIELAKNGH